MSVYELSALGFSSGLVSGLIALKVAVGFNLLSNAFSGDGV